MMGAEAFAHTAIEAKAFLPVSSRPYAVLVAGSGTEYVCKEYGGPTGLFQGLLGDPGETWRTFRVFEGQFPSEEDLPNYQGFVVTGSRQDAHSSLPWVLKLCEFIQKLHKEKVKLLGICFGHQVISRALGGKTGRSAQGWEVGRRKISVLDAFYAKPYASKVPASVTIVQIHQDEVYELPPNAELLASSEKTKVEMFAVEDHVLCVQGHPEFTDDVVLDILDVCQQNCLMPAAVISEARLSLEGTKADHELLKQLFKSFLKQTPPKIERPHCELECRD